MYDNWAGTLIEDQDGFSFIYESEYLQSESPEAISLTLPLRKEVYKSEMLFPFFDGLIPEGWLLDIAEKNWKFDIRDRMSILLSTCQDTIGAVSVELINNKNE